MVIMSHGHRAKQYLSQKQAIRNSIWCVYSIEEEKKKEVFSHFYLVGFRSNWESICVKVNIIKKSQAFKKRNIYERFLDEETAMVNHNKTSWWEDML